MKFELENGYIELQSVMGSDTEIVNAARISYLGETKGPEQDKKLLFYLWKNEHLTPFETAQLRIRVKCDVPTARQWFRHRAFHFNEVSRRYTDEEIAIYLPKEFRYQDTKNKQSSYTRDDYESQEISEQLKELVGDHYQRSLGLYYQMITAGVAKEQARYVLPMALMTEFVFVADLRNLLHFCRLRSDGHAQLEIRRFSDIILHEFIKTYFPWTYEVFNEAV